MHVGSGLFSPPTIFRRAGVHQRTAFNILLFGYRTLLVCGFSVMCKDGYKVTRGRKERLWAPYTCNEVSNPRVCAVCLCRVSCVVSVLVASCCRCAWGMDGEWATSLTLSPPPPPKVSGSVSHSDIKTSTCSRHLRSRGL
jgi:hypothetical protein